MELKARCSSSSSPDQKKPHRLAPARQISLIRGKGEGIVNHYSWFDICSFDDQKSVCIHWGRVTKAII